MILKWFHCPVCGQKLCRCTENAQGAFLKCKKCGNEVEVKSK